MLFILLIDDSLILSDSSGMMHYTKELMPQLLSVSMGLMEFMSSIMMFLSDLRMSTSLKPGVSIRVMFPVLATFTQVVTASKALPLLNSHAASSLEPSNSSANTAAIAERAVDLPQPHSPKTHAVHLSNSSKFFPSLCKC